MKTDLDHLPEQKQQELKTILSIVWEEFDRVQLRAEGKRKEGLVVKIILFGSYAKGTWVEDPENGYVSDYDILVIVNNKQLLDEYRIWSAVEDRTQQRVSTPLSLIVHTICDVNDQLNYGHYFFKDIREEGICLYEKDVKPLGRPGNLSPAEAKVIAEKHYAQWFESAKSFVIDFGHCMDRKDYKKAAFELHQAVERFLGCVALVFTNYRPKTHDIKRLQSLCIQQDAQFRNLFPSDTKFHRRCFEQLKRAYIDARYSEHFSITEEELNLLAAEVGKLQMMTEQVCRARIDSLTEE